MENPIECGTDLCTWTLAKRPNYSTNTDLVYPYSEIPYTGEYNLVKIPVSLNDLIQHVDYFGEGRIDNGGKIIGFKNSYNIHHEYRLVNSGPDMGKKIPNRIPLNRDNTDTSAFIKDNSVLIVTITDSRFRSEFAKDIARIINSDYGKVVVFGECFNSADKIEPLANELKKKGLLPSKDITLPSELQEITFYQSHVAFVKSDDNDPDNCDKIPDQECFKAVVCDLYQNIVSGNWGPAMDTSRRFSGAVKHVVIQLLKENPQLVMPYAYRLWYHGPSRVVRSDFPKSYHYILGSDSVTLVNKEYGMALKVDNSTTAETKNAAIYGDGSKTPKITTSMIWRFFPWCTKNDIGIAFRIRNDAYKNLYLRMDDEKITGDVNYWGTPLNEKEPDDKRFLFWLESWIEDDGKVVFTINNVLNHLRVTLDSKAVASGDRRVLGDANSKPPMADRFKWYIAPMVWSPPQ